MSIFGICFILYFHKLSACRGFSRNCLCRISNSVYIISASQDLCFCVPYNLPTLFRMRNNVIYLMCLNQEGSN